MVHQSVGARWLPKNQKRPSNFLLKKREILSLVHYVPHYVESFFSYRRRLVGLLETCQDVSLLLSLLFFLFPSCYCLWTFFEWVLEVDSNNTVAVSTGRYWWSQVVE